MSYRKSRDPEIMNRMYNILRHNCCCLQAATENTIPLGRLEEISIQSQAKIP
jgi:hypothetical protein